MSRAREAGQPLFRYAVSDDEFAALRERLEYLHRVGALEQANDRSAATFALYVSEWFRREYDGGGYSWESPHPEIIRRLSDAARKSLARQGLAWWGRRPRRTVHGEMRLMSLALEGGFPTRLLESREHGRIAHHLRDLLTRVEAAGQVDEDRAEQLSSMRGGELGSYDHEEFHALCAELVLAIMRLKVESAANAPVGVAASDWLDGVRPNWRDQLPIGLAGDGAKRLLDDLVSARAFRLGGGDARTHRLLLWRDGAWKSGLRLGMDGELSLVGTTLRPSDGRLRVHPAGALASIFAGELGLVEPPTDDTQGWLCRPRGRTLKAETPFEARAEVELRAGDTAATITWPNGEPLRSEVLLFADDREAATSPPIELGYIGQGSLRTRREKIYCVALSRFEARPLAGGAAITPIWRDDSHALFEVAESIRVGPPDGDNYRIELGADGERVEQLVIEGDVVRGAECADGVTPLYAGCPRLRVRRGGRTAQPPTNEVRWRRRSESVWRDWINDPPRMGDIEVVWRDAGSQALRDRQRFAVLPTDVRVRSKAAGRLRVAVELEAPPGWRLSTKPSESMEAEAVGTGLAVRFLARPSRRLALSLEGPGLGSLEVEVKSPIAGGGFFRADGSVFEDRARVMLSDLRGGIALSEGKERIYLNGPEQGSSYSDFIDEAPLWALSDEIVRLLSGGSALDDVVEIEFGRGGGAKLLVGRYAATLRVLDGAVSVTRDAATHSQAARRLEWYSILHPHYELISEGEGPASLPEGLVGPGVALLRAGDRVIGRPTLALGAPPAPMPDWTDLQAASLIPGLAERTGAVDAALRRLTADTHAAARDRDYLREMIASLRGMPPSALDALRRLARVPGALGALIATTADDGVLQSIWVLERDLPFLWCLVPIGAWQVSFELQRSGLEASLLAAGVSARLAPTIARESVARAAQALADLEPMLRQPLTFAGLLTPDGAAPPPLAESVQDRVRRIGHLIDDRDARLRPGVAEAPASCFRMPGSEIASQLPDYPFAPMHWEGLDASCAAALSAAGACQLGLRQVLRVRQARAEEPTSFADIFAAALNSLARNQPLSC